jgi:multicomponent Na+:H+ antiporter subunit C
VETVLALLSGAMVAASLFLMLGRHLVRFIFGLVLASNAVNLVICAAGRPGNPRPPLIPEGAQVPAGVVANSLPQALILTAIVIGFALLVFVFILFFKAHQELGTVNTEDMSDAEAIPAEAGAPEKVNP